ncbi:MAG: hypothetical protein N5P05_001995 [Chroococcopsis gigantea SAG 12.99]|jgi:hypothetical protein|nr:DUF2281 domain-containing protein [Chlorogloea purpurea SAG 13.99]MDV3000389.1 hypothetical protein [Chroococcopsis gigantea SAG 12.99]
MNPEANYDLSLDTNLRQWLHQKIQELSIPQLNSLRQFLEFLEYQQTSGQIDTGINNDEIDVIVASYRRQNSSLPAGLAKGQFVVPDDFNAPLPDDILDLFEPK